MRAGRERKKSVGRGVYPENWKEFLKIMDEIVPTSIPGQINKITLEYQRNVRFIQKMKKEQKMRQSTGIIKKK